MIGMNVKLVYREWYNRLCDTEIDNVCILRKMIEVREGWVICYKFNIGDVDFINNDSCVN